MRLQLNHCFHLILVLVNNPNPQSHFIITIPDSDRIQRPYTTVKTANQVLEALDEAKEKGYHLYLMQISYFIQSGEHQNEASDFQWVENAEDWYTKQNLL